MEIEVGIIISLVGVVISVIAFFVGQKTAAKKEGEQDGAIMTRLTSIDASVNEIKNSTASITKQLGEQRDRITRLEVKVDMYHGGSAHETKSAV